MLRKLVAALFALMICAGVSLADEIKGKVKEVNTEKNTLTVTVGDKDQTFTLNDDTQVLNPKGNAVKDKAKSLKGLKPDTEVTITSEKKDGKNVAVKIQLAGKK